MPHQPRPGEPPRGAPAEELLAMVAHELRQPLTALLGALTTLHQRRQALSVPQQQELLGMAHRQGEQLQQLLDQFLAAARLNQGPTRLARRSLVDAVAITKQAGHAARLAHPDHPISIEAAGPLLVWVDPLAVMRILGNLLDNAAIYSNPGTAIHLSARRDGLHAVVAVHDHGPGIPPDQRERIFQRYTRLDSPTASRSGGLGLGLYIARRLARAHHGDLQATEPSGGRGARFELRLPLEPPSRP
jgi:two-component system OmpR family sensor kinase